MGCAEPPSKASVGAPHQFHPRPVASYLMYADGRTFQ